MDFEKNGSMHSNNKDRQNSVLSGFSMQYCESIDGSDSSPKEDLICRKYYQVRLMAIIILHFSHITIHFFKDRYSVL